MKVVGIAGSLRQSALSRRLLLEAAARLGPDIEFEIISFNKVELFNEDTEENPSSYVTEFRSRISEADAVIISTPEYNGSLPGGLKNALDWASRSDNGLKGSAMYSKPVVVLSSSNGQFGGVWAADDLIKILKTQGSRVMKTKFSLPKADTQLDAGLSKTQQQQLQKTVDELINQTKAVKALLAIN